MHGGLRAPWTVQVGPSRTLVVAIAGGHLSAGAAVALAGLPWPLAIALSVALAASGAFHLARCALLRLPGSIVSLRIEGRGAAVVRFRNGREASATVLDSTVVAWRLTIVRLRLPGERAPRSVALLGDNCEAAAFRRLRVGLAWQAGPGHLTVDGLN
ncbi:MAG: hypothetical protein LXA50_00295 [Betaproteobacteria bacterium]|nr:hypothetical protein [Betaproteobacteria bacterium]